MSSELGELDYGLFYTLTIVSAMLPSPPHPNNFVVQLIRFYGSERQALLG